MKQFRDSQPIYQDFAALAFVDSPSSIESTTERLQVRESLSDHCQEGQTFLDAFADACSGLLNRGVASMTTKQTDSCPKEIVCQKAGHYKVSLVHLLMCVVDEASAFAP
jgi:hypothetical protein